MTITELLTQHSLELVGDYYDKAIKALNDDNETEAEKLFRAMPRDSQMDMIESMVAEFEEQVKEIQIFGKTEHLPVNQQTIMFFIKLI